METRRCKLIALFQGTVHTFWASLLFCQIFPAWKSQSLFINRAWKFLPPFSYKFTVLDCTFLRLFFFWRHFPAKTDRSWSDGFGFRGRASWYLIRRPWRFLIVFWIIIFGLRRLRGPRTSFAFFRAVWWQGKLSQTGCEVRFFESVIFIFSFSLFWFALIIIYFSLILKLQ